MRSAVSAQLSSPGGHKHNYQSPTEVEESRAATLLVRKNKCPPTLFISIKQNMFDQVQGIQNYMDSPPVLQLSPTF